jgi:hypothetical protein
LLRGGHHASGLYLHHAVTPPIHGRAARAIPTIDTPPNTKLMPTMRPIAQAKVAGKPIKMQTLSLTFSV